MRLFIVEKNLFLLQITNDHSETMTYNKPNRGGKNSGKTNHFI